MIETEGENGPFTFFAFGIGYFGVVRISGPEIQGSMYRDRLDLRQSNQVSKMRGETLTLNKRENGPFWGSF